MAKSPRRLKFRITTRLGQHIEVRGTRLAVNDETGSVTVWHSPDLIAGFYWQPDKVECLP